MTEKSNFDEGRQSEDEARQEADQVTEQLKQQFPEQEGRFTSEQYEKAGKEESENKYYQNLIWRRPTDEEVEKISSNLRVQTGTDTKYKSTYLLQNYKFTKLMEKTSSRRLIDLGSANRTLRDVENQILLERAGIKEYIAVDYDLSDRYVDLVTSPKMEDYEQYIKNRQSADPLKKTEISEPEQRIKSKGLRMEILQALHSFPENYGNVWMTGLDSMVFSLNGDWKFAVVAELKRVVPENGFIFTDGGFIDDVLAESIPSFKKAMEILMSGDRYGSKVTQEEVDKQLLKYVCRPDDLYNWDKETVVPSDSNGPPPRTKLGKYVIDAPEVGLRIYFDKIDLMYPMIIINTSKSPS